MIEKTSAGALIFYMGGNKPMFLLLKYTNYWGFVKGLMEKGEDELQTIKREAMEEANISKIMFLEGFRQIIKYFFKAEGQTISKTVVFRLGEISKEQAEDIIISSEHEDFKFLDFDEAMKIMKHKNEKDLLTEAKICIKEYSKQDRLG